MTKRVESLRAPCLDASSTLATSTSKRAIRRSFFVSVARSVNLWRLGRVICANYAVPYCSAITSLALIVKMLINAILVYLRNTCNTVARPRISSLALLSPAEVVRLSFATRIFFFFAFFVSAARSVNLWRLGRVRRHQ